MPLRSNYFGLSPARRLAGLCLLIVLSISSSSARAQIQVHSGGGIVFVSSESKAVAAKDTETLEGPDYGVWGTTLTSHAHDNPTNTDAGGAVTMGSSIDTTGFYVSSTGSAQTMGSDASTSGGAFAAVLFFVDQTQEFSGSTYFDPTTLGPLHIAAFIANVGLKDVALTNMIGGVANYAFHGRIAPGPYLYFYENAYGPALQSGYMTTIFNSVHFERVANPLVTQQPHDQTVQVGATAAFGLGTSSLASAVDARTASTAAATITTTFQWRRNYANLTNGGRISGATGNALQITSAAMADTGYYDCIVTRDTIVEPSSLVRLQVTASVAVGPTPLAPGLSLSAPSPNPFGTHTRVHFSLPTAMAVRLEVIDVAGRKVRDLIGGEQRAAGEYSVEWDGTAERGDRAASGVYFIRLRAGSDQIVRRVALLAD